MSARISTLVALGLGISLAILPAASADEEKTILLHGLESTEGAKGTWGTMSAKAIESNADRRFVSEGKGSLRLIVHSGTQADRRY